VGVAGLLLLLAAEPALTRAVAGAEVDFAAGTISARGGGAADWRMPSADVARPGAERRARAAALAKIRAALEALGVDKPSDAALARAKPVTVDYQSNGGVLLTLALRFADLGETKTEPVPVSVAAMTPELLPRFASGDRTVTPAFATYRTGAAPAGAVAARRDRHGKLLVEAAALDKLADVPLVIYVQKISRP
jgi:hypothetical protein